MTKAAIYVEDVLAREGVHNSGYKDTQKRLQKAKTYKDLSTICVVPTRGMVPARVVQSWLGLMAPMNQRFTRIIVEGLEVGEAYSQAIEMILGSEQLRDWRYLLTLEEDNMPPADGLLKLYESIEEGPYDVVSGLYFTKGLGGQPMAYGNPAESTMVNFIPWLPEPESVSPVYGIGMGFALWRLDIFKDQRIERPFFETVQRVIPGQGAQAYTQDLHACERLLKLGYRFAVDSRVRVGHFDHVEGVVW